MSRGRISAVFWLATMLMAIVPGLVSAQSRLVVEPFRGPSGGQMRALLVSDLESAGYEIVGSSEVDAALGDRTRRRLSTDDFTELSHHLNASRWIRGRVLHERRRWTLRVTVVDGMSGERVGGARWSGRTMRDMRAVGRSGARRLARYLSAGGTDSPATRRPSSSGETPAPGSAGSASRSSAAPERSASASPDGLPVRVSPPTEQSRTEQNGDPALEHADEELPPAFEGAETAREEADSLPGSASDSFYDGLLLSVSGGTLWRSFRTDALVYAARRGQAPRDPANTLIAEERGYTSSAIGHGELGIEGELYPGALSFGGEQPFPYLGLLFSFRHSVGLLSFGCERGSEICSGASQIDVPTSQLDLSTGLRGRYRFGQRRGDFMVFGELLYGLSAFVFDTERLRLVDYEAIVPPMEYHHIAIGAGFAVDPVQDLLTISLRADYRAGVHLGAKGREVWGLDTGPANGALVGLELRHQTLYLAPGLFVSLRAEYFFFETRFRGQVGCAQPNSCPELPPEEAYMDGTVWEPWPVDATGNVVGGVRESVFDHHVRWALHVGGVFR